VVKLILQRRTGGDTQVARNNNRKVVPEARAALDQMKYEVAGQVGVNLKKGYNGDLTSKEAGYVGGYMVKRMIEQAERQMAGK
jgi:hypothetical protein